MRVRSRDCCGTNGRAQASITGDVRLRPGIVVQGDGDIVVSTILVSLGMARVHRRYQEVSGHIPTVRVRLPWMRSVRGEEDSRPEVTVLDVIVVSTALMGVTAALVWFLFFAGSSLPSA